MRNVLFISYVFPPAGGVGVMRPLKFAKYLPLYGWRPIFLTSRDPGEAIDQSLSAEVAPETEVHYAWSARRLFAKPPVKESGMDPETSAWPRSPTRRGIKRLLNAVLIDRSVVWAPHAILKGIQIVRRDDVQVIFATGPPWWTHLVGWWLRRATRRPLVIDFRDQWSLGPPYGWYYSFQPALNRALERLAIAGADRVTVALPGLLRDFQARYPGHRPDKFTLITNGFDEEEIARADRHSLPQNGRMFTIALTGSVRAMTSPRNFLLAVRQLLDQGLLDSGKIRIRFAGRIDRESSGKSLPDYVREFNLSDVVELMGYVPHSEVPRIQREASALLQIHLPAPFEGASLPQKIFEYTAARRPVLALVPPDSAVADYLSRTGAGICADPGNVEEIASKLKFLYDTGGQFLVRDEREISKYSRRSLTGDLAKVFDSLTA